MLEGGEENKGLEEERSLALPQDIYDRMKDVLVELHQVDSLVEDFSRTKSNETIQRAVASLDQLSHRLESLAQVPEAQSRQNVPLLQIGRAHV